MQLILARRRRDRAALPARLEQRELSRGDRGSANQLHDARPRLALLFRLERAGFLGLDPGLGAVDVLPALAEQVHQIVDGPLDRVGTAIWIEIGVGLDLARSPARRRSSESGDPSRIRTCTPRSRNPILTLLPSLKSWRRCDGLEGKGSYEAMGTGAAR